MTEFQRQALLKLRDALKTCEAFGVSIEHDLDHMNICVKGEDDLHTGNICSGAVQAYLDGERFYSKP